MAETKIQGDRAAKGVVISKANIGVNHRPLASSPAAHPEIGGKTMPALPKGGK
jgi:hypothetical protein